MPSFRVRFVDKPTLPFVRHDSYLIDDATSAADAIRKATVRCASRCKGPLFAQAVRSDGGERLVDLAKHHPGPESLTFLAAFATIPRTDAELARVFG